MPDIFIHIPRTGGTTLTTTLRWVYGPWASYRDNPERPEYIDEFITKMRKEVSAPRLVAGHVHYGVHRHLDDPARYFTLLRHPLRQYISRFNFLKFGYPNSYESMSLTDFCRSDDPWSRPNDQVRFISGEDPAQDPKAILEKAQDHLLNKIDVFGITERYDESILLFRRRLGWSRPPFYIISLSNKERPTLEELSSKELEAVKERNQLDMELYQFAKRHFEDALEAEFSNLSDKIRTFRRRNHVAQWIAPPLLSLYRSGRSVLQQIS